MRPWEQLLAMLRAARKWPIPQEIVVRRQLAVWAALRENHEATIRLLMQWPGDRPLLIDNLPEKIGSAYGDLLFGEAPEFKPATDGDADRLRDLVQPWMGELPAAETTCVTEGEVWWRITTDPELTHPVLSWHSRTDVVPLLRGRNVLAVAFISRLPQIGNDKDTVYRHVELHDRGLVVNLLFQGRSEVLGSPVDLARHMETSELAERWDTGVDGLLAGRIVNRWGRRPLVGVSIYAGVWTRMLALNEATTVGRENMRLTAKKRAVVPSSALRSPGNIDPTGVPMIGDRPAESIDRGDGVRIPVRQGATFDAGEDILVADSLDMDEGDDRHGPFKILEYEFDAEALIAWLRFEIETICQRCDLVPQFIGSGDFGIGASGTALRVRLLPTENAAESRGKAWDPELPVITQRGQLLEVQPAVYGGAGIAWTNPGGLPIVTRAPALPDDENEIASRHAQLRAADLISIETSLRERFPGREDDWYEDERGRIVADLRDTMPGATSFGGPAPPPPPPEG